MDEISLRTFLAIVETRSLVRASESQNVTQSTVTARLKMLEERVGQTLILRQKSGARLTAAGYKFLRYAQILSGLWEQAKQETALPVGITALCNIGCHAELWEGFGRAIFNRIYHQHPDTAVSFWPGDQQEIENWLGTGLTDAAITYQPTGHADQSVHVLHTEKLVLYSTRKGSPAKFDPDYVFVDYGTAFRQNHATSYSDAGIAKVSFGSALWARDHLLENGGSAYLPDRLAAPSLKRGELHIVDSAPEFSRAAYLVTNDLAVDNWPWLIDLVSQASSEILNFPETS